LGVAKIFIFTDGLAVTDSSGSSFLKKTRWPIFGVALLAAGAAAYQFLPRGPSTQEVRRPAIPVVAVAVERHDVSHAAEVAGTVESLHSVVIRPQVDGILTEIQFNEGDQVEEGQLLAVIDDRAFQAALAAAKAEVTRDVAQLRAAEQDLVRSRELVQRGAVSQAMVDKQTAEVDQFKAAIQVGEAKVRTAEVNRSYTRITSPVRGRAGIRRVDPGNLVRSNDPNGLVTIAQVDPISVVFPTPQSILAALRAYSRTKNGGTVEAFDRMTNQVLARGRITAFDNTVDITTGTAKVRAEFDNKSELLAPGQFVSVRISTGISENALVVPAVAVRPGSEGNYVYRIVEGTAERVNVALGYTDDDIAVITEGLSEGDRVVTDGMSRLATGAHVTLREAGARGAGSSAASGATQ
jgi:RND family efflux transporter MFP subunit